MANMGEALVRIDAHTAELMGLGSVHRLRSHIKIAQECGLLRPVSGEGKYGQPYVFRLAELAEAMGRVEGCIRERRADGNRRSGLARRKPKKDTRPGAPPPEELAIGEKYNVTNAAGRTCTGIYRGWSNPSSKLIRLLEIAGKRITIFGNDAVVKPAPKRRKLSVMDFDGTTAVRCKPGAAETELTRLSHCNAEDHTMQYELAWEKVKKQLGYSKGEN